MPFYPLKTPKIKIFKNEKIYWRYYHFTHVYQKSQSLWCTVPKIRSKTDRIFCHFGPFFAFLPLLPLMIPKIKILKKKKMKKMPGDTIIFILYTHVYHKWKSYDIWFLKYKVWKTEIFVIFGQFFALSAPLKPGKSKF